MTDLKWIKSSYSNGSSACVEIARDPDNPLGDFMGVRHSKHPGGTSLWFTRAEWDAFYKGLLDGEFE